jgi:hypothetical protein
LLPYAKSKRRKPTSSFSSSSLPLYVNCYYFSGFLHII